MGRHGDALTAYETAYEHLRSDINNLQLAKLLWLWGSSMAKLGIQGAKIKLDQALGIAKGTWQWGVVVSMAWNTVLIQIASFRNSIN